MKLKKIVISIAIILAVSFSISGIVDADDDAGPTRPSGLESAEYNINILV